MTINFDEQIIYENFDIFEVYIQYTIYDSNSE